MYQCTKFNNHLNVSSNKIKELREKKSLISYGFIYEISFSWN